MVKGVPEYGADVGSTPTIRLTQKLNFLVSPHANQYFIGARTREEARKMLAVAFPWFVSKNHYFRISTVYA